MPYDRPPTLRLRLRSSLRGWALLEFSSEGVEYAFYLAHAVFFYYFHIQRHAESGFLGDGEMAVLKTQAFL